LFRFSYKQASLSVYHRTGIERAQYNNNNILYTPAAVSVSCSPQPLRTRTRQTCLSDKHLLSWYTRNRPALAVTYHFVKTAFSRILCYIHDHRPTHIYILYLAILSVCLLQFIIFLLSVCFILEKRFKSNLEFRLKWFRIARMIIFFIFFVFLGMICVKCTKTHTLRGRAFTVMCLFVVFTFVFTDLVFHADQRFRITGAAQNRY